MPVRITLDLNTGDYIGLPATGSPFTLSELQVQLLLTLLQLAYDRDAWETMGDSAWDAWAAALSDLQESLT